jgi:hypothetical protein
MVAGIVLAAASVRAQASPPAAHQDAAFDVMNLLAHHGLHDIDDESWNLYGQSTFIGSFKPGFGGGPYDLNGSTNSLKPGAEESFTWSTTLFFGLEPWHGGKLYFVPEFIAEQPLSDLHGLGGAIQNFELQKQGTTVPQLYRSRLYFQETVGLGGKRVVQESNPMQLGTVTDARRVVLTGGSFSTLDIFDKNTVSWDPRQTFFNMAFMTYASWDFPADARGYSWGATGEFYWDDWAVRFGRMMPPQDPNSAGIDFRFWQFYGDQLEIEHDHEILGQAGAVRVLGYHNHVDTGNFTDAIAKFESDPTEFNAAKCGSLYSYNSENKTAPDLCFVRQPNDKFGVGLDVEQYVTENVGLFLRAMYSDGRTEVDAFNSADRSVAFGAVAKGGAWQRPFDVAGVGVGASWISDDHARYLAMGGVDGFVGDGYLEQAAEGVTEAFYSFNVLKAVWFSADYQFIWNPGFNAARGPLHVLGGRVHVEF